YESNIIYLMMAQEVVKPILQKVAKILNFETTLNKRKLQNQKKLNENLHYVNDIMKSIHFLKNKFTPIKTYFQLSDKKVPEQKQHAFNVLLQETKDRALISLAAIESKTLQVLDKTKSPFSSYEMSKMKYKHFYMLIKEIWTENFSESSIIIRCSPDDMESSFFNTNRNLLEFLFTDIIENIRKYSNGNQTIIFEYDNTQAKIVLQNDVKDGLKKKQELKEIVDNFNNSDRLEINRRSSFGLVHIMELSEMLGIECELSFIDNKYFTTTLILQGVLK
ncbi:hypothetical protein KKA17_08195, partial [bacterium]|nr:hypothetical protein [bacterium]